MPRGASIPDISDISDTLDISDLSQISDISDMSHILDISDMSDILGNTSDISNILNTSHNTSDSHTSRDIALPTTFQIFQTCQKIFEMLEKTLNQSYIKRKVGPCENARAQPHWSSLVKTSLRRIAARTFVPLAFWLVQP